MPPSVKTARPYPKRRDPLKAGDRVFPNLEARNAALAEAYRNGAGMVEIGAVFPVSVYTIYKILAAHGVAVRSPGAPAPEGGREARNARIKELHMMGKTAPDIAAEFGLHPTSIHTITAEMDLPTGLEVRKQIRAQAKATARAARQAAAAIEDETRYGPWRAMAAKGASVAEIAEHFGVHYNTARKHTAPARKFVRRSRKSSEANK